jgi:hypothetical protein
MEDTFDSMPVDPSPKTGSVFSRPTDEEIKTLAEDIVRFCPSLTHLLLAMSPSDRPNPLQGLN